MTGVGHHRRRATDRPFRCSSFLGSTLDPYKIRSQLLADATSREAYAQVKGDFINKVVEHALAEIYLREH